MTFNTSVPVTVSTQPVMVLFEGADRYVLTGGQPVKSPGVFASARPRITADGNENILAPSWAQGYTLDPPSGWDYEAYMPVSVPVPGQPGAVLVPGDPPFSVIPVVNANTVVQTALIQVDQSNELSVRRLLFDVQADSSITAGRVLVRISTGSGYTLTEDYIDAEQYIGASLLAKPWDVAAGDQIIFELQLVVDNPLVVQSGNIYFRAFADGVRKIRS